MGVSSCGRSALLTVRAVMVGGRPHDPPSQIYLTNLFHHPGGHSPIAEFTCWQSLFGRRSREVSRSDTAKPQQPFAQNSWVCTCTLPTVSFDAANATHSDEFWPRTNGSCLQGVPRRSAHVSKESTARKAAIATEPVKGARNRLCGRLRHKMRPDKQRPTKQGQRAFPVARP